MLSVLRLLGVASRYCQQLFVSSMLFLIVLNLEFFSLQMIAHAGGGCLGSWTGDHHPAGRGRLLVSQSVGWVSPLKDGKVSARLPSSCCSLVLKTSCVGESLRVHGGSKDRPLSPLHLGFLELCVRDTAVLARARTSADEKRTVKASSARRPPSRQTPLISVLLVRTTSGFKRRALAPSKRVHSSLTRRCRTQTRRCCGVSTRWYTSSLGRVCCARNQSDLTGTDRCR